MYWRLHYYNGYVSTNALNCPGCDIDSVGIPCRHRMMEHITGVTSGVLLPGEFDAHWWLDRAQAPICIPRVREPATRQVKPRHRGAKRHAKGYGSSGTRRDFLLSERVDANIDTNAPAAYQNPPMQPFSTSVQGYSTWTGPASPYHQDVVCSIQTNTSYSQIVPDHEVAYQPYQPAFIPARAYMYAGV